MQNFDIKDKRNIFMLAILLVAGGMVFGFYNNYWADFTIKAEKIKSENDKKKQTLKEVEVKRKQKALMEKDLQKAEGEFQKYKKMFPDEEKVPFRLRDLYGVIRSSGVRIKQFRPKDITAREHFNENNYDLSVEAGYHMLGHLFADIANFDYPTNIRNLTINRYGGIQRELADADRHGWTPITLNVSFILTTFSSRTSNAVE